MLYNIQEEQKGYTERLLFVIIGYTEISRNPSCKVISYNMHQTNMARIMNILMQVAFIAVLTLAYMSPALAQNEVECPPTIEGLRECIDHHYSEGNISQGTYNSLLAKADAAQAARDRGQADTAGNILNAFIKQVSAQSSKNITSEAAIHMIDHAQMVIEEL
jgi:hypothetical protein